MPADKLKLYNIRENNLKGIDAEIPHDLFTVVTGLSGSGKSSLAFNTVYAEGQQRYIETFSPYTRQFFDKVKRPALDAAENVRPAIAIQQKTRITNSRSTVGTLAGINDYLKIVWANLSVPFCPVCGEKIVAYNRESTLEEAVSLSIPAEKTFVGLIIPFKKQKEFLEKLISTGYSRILDTKSGELKLLEDLKPSNIRSCLFEKKFIITVLERFKSGKYNKETLKEAINQAWHSESRTSAILTFDGTAHRRYRKNSISLQTEKAYPFSLNLFSSILECPCGKSKLPEPTPSLFSSNHPAGACPECNGFGNILKLDPALCVPDPRRSLSDGALACWNGPSHQKLVKRLLEFCLEEKLNTKIPWQELSPESQDKVFNSKTKTYRGVSHWFKLRERKAYKMHVRVMLARFRSQSECQSCKGKRFKPELLAFRIKGHSIADIIDLTAEELLNWLDAPEISSSARLSPQLKQVMKELRSRADILNKLGLGYLASSRQSRTLSGGETQRVNLAAALNSNLQAAHFVLDEPSAGLHSRDSEKLLKCLLELRQNKNSLLVVEHDPDIIKAAEHIIEIGPAAGNNGGEIVYTGSYKRWKNKPYFSSKQNLSDLKLKKTDPVIKIKKACARNLKNQNFTIPLNKLVSLSGVSGSGKSSFVSQVLQKAWDEFNGLLQPDAPWSDSSGFNQIEDLLHIDQTPLSKNPRGNIATYSKIWDTIRELLADTSAAREHAFTKSTFSFNLDGGRCPVCRGAGYSKEDMQFLSDVYLPCETCLGKRFQTAVLQIEHLDRNVDDYLNMTVSEAHELFQSNHRISQTTELLMKLGLDYLRLGHPLSELSGGEAQRLKLIPLLRKSSKKKALLVFDEPTTGLNFKDIEKLIFLLKELVQKGHSVLCIEHNLQLLAASEWIIDLGPEGGDGGGQIICKGSPADYLKKTAQKKSWTAKALLVFLNPQDEATVNYENKSDINNSENLEVKGAREHNLKNISFSIPHNKMVAVTGISGSGKSTVARDIIFAEGQRRFLDCLSPYARHFIKDLKHAEIDQIQNLRPTICVHQHTFQPSRLSTIATLSEIYNYLRLLFSKTGQQFCPQHPETPVDHQTADGIAVEIKKIKTTRLRILSPVIKGKKGKHQAVIRQAIESDISEIRVDGSFLNPARIEEGLTAGKAHYIEYVTSSFNPARTPLKLISSAVEQALSLSDGAVITVANNSETIYSTARTCPVCKKGYLKPDPEDLSFNSKRGSCQLCNGSGKDDSDSLCLECGGSRLRSLALNLKINNKNIHDCCLMTAAELNLFLKNIPLKETQRKMASPVLRELFDKLSTLIELGLDYLPLDRDCNVLSSGELQRLRIAAATGSPLTGACYIFDEPSAGLHPSENIRVISKLKALNKMGNSVLIIEHDPDTIKSCDYVLDIGPGGGKHGGEIVFSGSIKKFKASRTSVTARYLKKSDKIEAVPVTEKQAFLHASKASKNNLKNFECSIPLNALVTVTGVSGAGKSSLVTGVIAEAILANRKNTNSWKGASGNLKTDIPVNQLIVIDQKPFFGSRRSTPGSYLGVWDEIRKVFAGTIDARMRGWNVSFFSFNTGKGRCSHCKGTGETRLEMSFLPDARIECEFCQGRRFTAETNSVRYLDTSISEVLEMTIEEALELFKNHRKIQKRLKHCVELGLGYLTLGQSSSSLSGGECQRLKIVSHLSKNSNGHTLFILDEPTTGLHRADTAKLIYSLNKLILAENSVIVIEHDTDFIKASSWITELGPGPGEAGGSITFNDPAPLYIKSNKL